MKRFQKKLNFISFFLLLILFFGCKSDDDGPQVVANFTFTIEGDTAIFVNTSEQATTYLWDFGDGSTSTEINPTKIYVSGTFTVKLTASASEGSFDSIEDEITVVALNKATLPITFDDATVNNEAVTFGGTNFRIIENPDISGTNPTVSNVGEIRNSGVAFEGIFFELATEVEFAIEKTIQINFWADAPIAVLLRMEGPNANEVEVLVSHSGMGWEELLFTFDSIDEYSKLTFIVDPGGTKEGLFLIDSINQIETPNSAVGCTANLVEAMTLPLDFEGCETFLSSLNFGSGISSALIENPFKIGINTSDFVLKIDKPAGSEFFAGVQNIFPSNFDLTDTDTFIAKVYSTRANVVFRFELLANPNDGSIGNPTPVFVTIPNANEWVEIEFTFTNLPASPTAYRQLVIKPDNDQTDSPITQDGSYFIDDIDLVGSGGGGDGDTDSNLDAGIIVNGDFESGVAPWIGNGVNLQSENRNEFNFVNIMTAGEASSVTISQVTEIVEGTNYILTFDASSDRERTILAGIGLNEAPFTETTPTVNLTTTSQTYTLQLTAGDFGNSNSRVLFNMGAELGAVSLDNITLFTGGDGRDSNGGNPLEVPSGGCTDTFEEAIKLPLNFEGCETFLSSLNFGNGLTSELVANPFKTGINTSDFVLRIDKPAGSEFFAGVQNIFVNNFDLRTSSTFKLKVYSTKANVVFRFELLANPNDGSIGNPTPVFVPISDANEWIEVEFTFTNLPASPTAYSQLVIKPDNNENDGAITMDGTYFIDDLIHN
ncbi:carbohydrate binding domain-containing protein [Croceitalea vernalis]|uniref:Carbohydrate binding domain-containing protein n=1 Tax=Croceitalea vernalis TaxID=3075599 RepID=A0ABU3BJA0_9FLAO|nr:carbohydrate binding domain-containing protein [Croceitalea sp. P007]MDT0622236.1 carbohydrate binding domain-containing protein [Croceitalea sp. P007]